jgi:hypothetical protein
LRDVFEVQNGEVKMINAAGRRHCRPTTRMSAVP